MLAKVPRPGRDFAGLRRYLLDGGMGEKPDPRRVLWTCVRNLMSDDPNLVTKIMTATADKSKRVQRPVYHLAISWRSDERPTDDIMRKVAETTLTDIGLHEHQAFIVAHGDTANPHMHIVVNRVHPETGVAWSTSHDYRRIEESMRRQSEAHGYERVPGRHTEPEQVQAPARSDGEYQLLKKRRRQAVPQWSKAQAKAIGRRVKDLTETATCWDELEAGLDALGGAFVAKGQGLILTDHKRSGYAKLSSLGAGLRLADMEQRFAESFKAFRARGALRETSARPLVSEIDILLALEKVGIVDKAAVKAGFDARAAETTSTVDREMREALKSALSGPRRSKKPARVLKPPEPDPEPTP